MVHCLALPLLIAFLPIWFGWIDVPDSFHVVVLLIALPFSSVILWRAEKRSVHMLFTLRLGLLGLGLMAGSLLLEGQVVEPWVTTAGAAMLAAAHIMNWRSRMSCPE
ncbi:MerC family mercury resistance protein [Altererythrobacter endophyticus]|uniref:MerC family mercury resistance protein n=2 Tax=Altericroceibacterium endophyticum TaxID=1808508 RepID=A0A6I4T5P8_9SPHN|nr:MerC family mercury resistance protein [Altericroceibacterium endophyticum]